MREIAVTGKGATLPIGRSETQRGGRLGGRARRRGLSAALFVTPLLALLGAFMLYPIVSAVDLSLRNAKTFSSVAAPYVAFQNYSDLIRDPEFLPLAWHSLLRGAGGAIPSYFVGLAAALALNRRAPGMAALRVAALIPFVLSTPIAVNTWLQLIDPHFGFLGTRFGTGNSLLADPNTVWPALLLVNTWFSFQFYAILLLAALQRIPPELYEAAQVDGAGVLRQFLHVTMPALGRVSAVFLGIHFMLSFQEVNLVLIATGGGPANATQTLATYAYQTGFRSFNIGSAAAISIASCIVMFGVVAVVGLFGYLVAQLRGSARVAVSSRLAPLSRLRLRPRRAHRRGNVFGHKGERRVPRPARRVLGYLPAAVAALVGVVPLLFLFSQSFDGSPAGAYRMSLFPRKLSVKNYVDVLGKSDLRVSRGGAVPPLFLNFFNSVAVAALVTALVLVVAGPAGYGLSRASGRWSTVVTILVVVVQFVPPVLLVFPLYRELALIGLLNSRIGLGIVTSVLSMPLSTLLFKTFFDSSPRELEEAAAIDGAGPVRIFRSVVIPISRPVIGAVAAFSLISSWNEFLFSLTFITDTASRTLPSALYLFTSTQNYAANTSPGQQAVYLVVPTVLAVALLAMTQRHFTAAYQGGGVKE